MSRSLAAVALMTLAGAGFARQVPVTTSIGLMDATKAAVAGDTILVAPGTYTGSTSGSGDPGNLPNGRGYFWIGNDGTAAHPIVVVAQDPANMPVLQGTTVSTGYVFHVTGDHVVLKSLKLTTGDKAVMFDNASFGILEDCEAYNSGMELVHVRDSSSHVVISRNKIYNSGNGGNGSLGEGLYIGTDQARWGAADVPQSSWGSLAVSEGYGGFDWRVDSTLVTCNYFSGSISAELIDIKEGTQYTMVKGNVFIGDSIAMKAGAASENDSYIDQKGVKGVFTGNVFFGGSAKVTKFIAEVVRSFPQVPASLTPAGYASPWCDVGDADSNDCTAAKNTVATSAPADPRTSACNPYFDMDWAALGSTPTHILRTLQPKAVFQHFGYDLLGRAAR